MADTKISALTELTAPASGDIFAIVDDPSGSPVTKKITIDNLDLSLMDGAPTGTIVGTTDTQTLTNKTLTSPTVNYGDSMPSTNVRCRVEMSSDQSLTTSYAVLPFDNEVFDSGSDFNTSTYQFTAPVTGYYFVSYGFQIRGATSGDGIGHGIFVNGSVNLICPSERYEANFWGQNSGVIYATSGQTIDVEVKNASGERGTVYYGTDGYTHFSVHLLST